VSAPRAELLERLRGRLIVSVQAEPGSLLGAPETIALMARSVVQNGAAAVRIEGAERIRAVRAALDVPIVGLIKRAHAGFEPYITSTRAEIEEVAAAGADLVAFDATVRPHAGGASVSDLIATVHARGLPAFADCAEPADGEAARAAQADVLATTLAGYTPATAGRMLPALDLLAALGAYASFVVCEGGIASPDDVRAAFEGGASAVVVGTAITNVDALTRRFAAAAPAGPVERST
jgi:N-acylglucosamine-6-phosphate 2-epimerase